MKTMMKLFLAISLFCSVALADGDMGGGGAQGCPTNCPPPCTQGCLVSNEPADQVKSSDWILIFVKGYLFSRF